MSKLEDQTTLNAKEHISFLSFMLGVFEKVEDNFMALVGDNCDVNHAISDRMKIVLIGCASHKY